MPIYEYRCPNGHLFELFQRMSDAQPEKCEVCGAGPLERVLYPVAVHFKGSGFYSTDYGRGGGRKTKDGDSGSSAGDSGDSGGAGGKDKPSEPKKATETSS
jgi:putative FmdB family regulatory protein